MRWIALGLAVIAGCGRIDFDDLLICDSSNPDLVGCWAFEGNTLDGSQYHNDATAGDVTYVPGHDGLAVLTDSATSMLIAEAPSLDVSQALTIDVWIDLVAYPPVTNGFVFDNNNQYSLAINPDGTVNGDVVTGATTFVNTTQRVSLGEWHHIALRYDVSATLDVVVDGVVTSVAQTGAIQTVGVDGSRIAGDAGTVVQPPIIGALDDLLVWRVARDDAGQ